ncbi:hypothetical protein H9Y04_24545 [Streptomyces sp. TRM66268-LWL]|uniref:Uncharacterized protein n=1 Tax=Streptomyces polyasparticus TaxID=2767826 RepID=A0ABR7SMW9_9ACTN|nr:hypothetical protein [Streptomyces polyasparticus]MBC9715718.1 hypothetical protein [Streptomyces polyasparticus]
MYCGNPLSPTLHAIKVGICNVGSQRLAVHNRYGWQLHRQLSFEHGRDARDVEQIVLSTLKSQGLKPYLSAWEMPQAGWRETFDGTVVTEDMAWTLVTETARRHQLQTRPIVVTGPTRAVGGNAQPPVPAARSVGAYERLTLYGTLEALGED